MKKILLLGLQYIFCQLVIGQTGNYWQQKADFNISVSLNDTAHTLDGELKMIYHNNSPDTLTFIWIHLWPNAYKNDRTAFSDQLLENGRTDFYFSEEEKRGYINRLAFKVNNVSAQAEDHPQHQDIVKLLLPKPLAPGEAINIETPFHVKIPYIFSRSGYKGAAFAITQWYPKPAVYDKRGWHEMPYLDQGEFYSEYGDYEVSITVPKKYIVAATGKQQSILSSGENSTSVYHQNNVHDFAWFANKDFIVQHDTLQLASKTIDIYAYSTGKHSKLWNSALPFIKDAVTTKSKWLGEYPYDVVSIVENVADGAGDGMEYPTIAFIETPTNDEKQFDLLVNHEVGHNWFYGILGTNEREHPWMDEGLNSYYDYRYIQQKYNDKAPGASAANTSFLKNRLPEDDQEMFLKTLISVNKDQPIETTSENFSSANYGLVAYTKTAKWMQLLEKELGTELFDSCMKTYFQRYKFTHPAPEDFKKTLTEVSGRDLNNQFSLLQKKGYLAPAQKKDIKISTVFNFKDADKHNYIILTPAAGYNAYDKLMIGGMIHNYTLPLNKFRFIAVPLYATGSKQLNGIGNINYNYFSENKINKITMGVSGARFSTKQSLDTFGRKIFENFYKVVPYVQLYFKHPPRSTKSTWIDIRTYFIGEQKFDNGSYAVIAGSDSTVSYPNKTVRSTRYINQVSFNMADDRVLYPYFGQLQFQQGKGFYRANLNANYFFNYSKGGGLQVRLFAAKFGYIGDDNNFDAFQYQPKLLAATGEEDYTYSNYFIGRTGSTANSETPVKNLGLGAHQVMIRDGGLKLRVDQSYFLQGRSENWVAAFNFNSTIPDIFPVKLPIKLFFDAGSYAEGWKEDALTSKVLYVGGLQLSLFKNIVNIYAPLIYSKDFRDNLKTFPEQNTFLKRMTFSIDIQNLRLAKLFPQLSL